MSEFTNAAKIAELERKMGLLKEIVDTQNASIQNQARLLDVACKQIKSLTDRKPPAQSGESDFIYCGPGDFRRKH